MQGIIWYSTFNYFNQKHHQSNTERIIKVTVTSMSKIANPAGYWTWKYQCSSLQHSSTWLELSHLRLESVKNRRFSPEEKVKWGKEEALQDSLPELPRFIPIKQNFPTPPRPSTEMVLMSKRFCFSQALSTKSCHNHSVLWCISSKRAQITTARPWTLPCSAEVWDCFIPPHSFLSCFSVQNCSY